MLAMCTGWVKKISCFAACLLKTNIGYHTFSLNYGLIIKIHSVLRVIYSSTHILPYLQPFEYVFKDMEFQGFFPITAPWQFLSCSERLIHFDHTIYVEINGIGMKVLLTWPYKHHVSGIVVDLLLMDIFVRFYIYLLSLGCFLL